MTDTTKARELTVADVDAIAAAGSGWCNEEQIASVCRMARAMAALQANPGWMLHRMWRGAKPFIEVMAWGEEDAKSDEWVFTAEGETPLEAVEAAVARAAEGGE